MSPNPAKDTIYIDIDDEITNIIDRVREANTAIVALVLPKRATMLQSSVNMKLLKKATASAKKQVVLITTEAGLLPLASSIGLYVAKDLQSKPEVPTAATAEADVDELVAVDDEEPAKEFDAKTAAKKPVGELAGTAAEAEAVAAATKPAKPELTPMPIPRAKPEDTEDETIELDDEKDGAAVGAASAEAADADDKKAKNKDSKKLKVPNFESFRLRLILAGVLLIILIVGFILANIILPKASITITTKTTGIDSSLTLNLSPAAKTLDPTQLTVPTTVQQTQKASAGQAATTGQKNEGTAATGQVKLTNCTSDGSSVTVPSGTGVTTSGLTFITQNSATLTTSTFDSHGNCKSTAVSSQTVSITAQNAGSQYNVSNVSFSVASQSSGAVQATGSASGGTDNIVQTVTQADIDSATAKIATPDSSAIKTALQTALQQAGLYAIPVTFNTGSPSVVPSANVGDQATTVTVTQTITYTMLGVHQSDLQKLIDSSVNQQIDTAKQSILDDGLKSANFNVLSNSGASGAQATMQATATVGSKFDIASLKNQVAGKKTGDVQNIINANPGVTNVTVHYSPFWVSSMPKHASKITIQIKKSS